MKTKVFIGYKKDFDNYPKQEDERWILVNSNEKSQGIIVKEKDIILGHQAYRLPDYCRIMLNLRR